MIIATGDTDSAAVKKSKVPKVVPVDEGKPKTKKQGKSTEDASSIQNGTENVVKKSKSTSDTITAKKQLAAQKVEADAKDKQGKTKENKFAKTVPITEDEEEDDVEDSEEDEIDDQTDALLKGFESDNDDEKDPEDQVFEAGQKIPKVDKKARKAAQAAEKASASDRPGVIYIGRIPHGFYEQEMKQYFSQFGDISNLRLSRNRKTGRSKHFAFVEFKSAEVADIVSRTMDNYLLFGHILKCKMVAPEQVHKSLWEGANKRFKKVPWNKMEGRKLKQGMTEAGWNKRVEKEEIRRANKQAAMKLMDYEFEIPKLKSATDVAQKNQELLAITAGGGSDHEDTKAIEAPTPVDAGTNDEAAEAAKSKKSKKKNMNGGADIGVTGGVNNVEASAVSAEAPSKKKKKTNDADINTSGPVEGAVEVENPASKDIAKAELVEKAGKVKKSKKTKSN
jgi:nucleolar protein 15